MAVPIAHDLRTHRYVLDDVGLIEIRAGTKVGCWTCHNGPSGEDDDRDDRDGDD